MDTIPGPFEVVVKRNVRYSIDTHIKCAYTLKGYIHVIELIMRKFACSGVILSIRLLSLKCDIDITATFVVCAHVMKMS